jgi:hypothetical protein
VCSLRLWLAMGCGSSAEAATGVRTPSDISESSAPQIDSATLPAPGPTEENGQIKRITREGNGDSDKSVPEERTTTPSIQTKRPSLLSLSNDSSLTDITVNIPDPFRSNYKVTDSLYHKNFRKLYRGIDKNRRDVLVEFTELRAYGLAGYSQVDFFDRIDMIRDLNHPSIPRVLDIYDGPEVNRVVFDYFPGKDLDCLLKMKGSLPPHAIKPFMLALVTIVQVTPLFLFSLLSCHSPWAIGCQYIHSQKMIHRNISPSSIIMAAFSSFVSVQQMRVTGFTRPVRLNGEGLYHHGASNGSLDLDDSSSPSPLRQINLDVFSAPELCSPTQGPEVDLYSIGNLFAHLASSI